MSKNATLSDEPIVHTTSRGGRYVNPFDIIRSKVGRLVIMNYVRRNNPSKSSKSERLPVSPETEKK